QKIFTGEVLSVTQSKFDTRTLRPSADSRAWNRGLTENVWSCMESCLDKDPLRRPTATEVVQLLTEGDIESTQASLGAQETSSEKQFRRRITEPVGADTLNEILDPSRKTSTEFRYRQLRNSLLVHKAKAETLKFFKSENARLNPDRLEELHKTESKILTIRQQINQLEVSLRIKAQVFTEELSEKLAMMLR
ncbi:hypothetical protein C0992_005264, partial [Termitomyces sp. T32_za158]